MSFQNIRRLLALGLALLAALPAAHAAQQITQKQSDSQSIELTNLDGPDTGTEAAVPSAGSASAADAATTADARTGAVREGKEQASAAPVASPAKAPAATPMEKYRDTKLLQAATPNAGNPATARRYLKVDRATFLESAGLQ